MGKKALLFDAIRPTRVAARAAGVIKKQELMVSSPYKLDHLSVMEPPVHGGH